MRTARSKRGLTTEVVVDSKGQPFDKNVKPEQMHEGDAALQFFSYIGKLQGEMTPEQKATVARELDQMVAAQRRELGLPQSASPYQPGMVIEWGDQIEGLGIVECFHGNSVQIRRVNDRGKTFTSVIDLIGTSEVEGRIGIEGLILEIAARSPLILSIPKAKLLKSKDAIRELFLSEVRAEVKETILDRLDCSAEEYLAIIRANRNACDLIKRLAVKAADDRVMVLAAVYTCRPSLLEGVSDQDLLAAIVGLDAKFLTAKLGDYGYIAKIEPLREKAGGLIHDQRILEELAETGPSDIRESAALRLNDPDGWILGSAEMNIEQVDAWVEKFSDWDTGRVNKLAQDTELRLNHGMFDAFRRSGKLTQETYEAIVEKYEGLSTWSQKGFWYLLEIEDREFMAGRIKRWAETPAEVEKLVTACGRVTRSSTAAKPYIQRAAYIIEAVAMLPAFSNPGEVSVEQQIPFIALFRISDSIYDSDGRRQILERLRDKADMPSVRSRAAELLRNLQEGGN